MSIASRRRILLAGAVLAALGVALGAFGAHALRATLDERHLGWWRTGVEYQMSDIGRARASRTR